MAPRPLSCLPALNHVLLDALPLRSFDGVPLTLALFPCTSLLRSDLKAYQYVNTVKSSATTRWCGKCVERL